MMKPVLKNTGAIRHRPALATLLSLIFLAACGSGSDSDPMLDVNTAAGPVQSPWDTLVTFAGTIPCASCPGIDMAIHLKPDGTAFLRSIYREAEDGEDRSVAEPGRWALTADSRILVLRHGASDVKRFAFVSADTLTMLDSSGRPVASELPNDLVRVDDAGSIVVDTELAGMYQYYADAALVQLCATGKRYPVALEEAHVDLERAYLAAVSEAAQPLFARFTGKIETRAAEEGVGERDFVIIRAFDSVDPEASCFGDDAPVEGTVWRLTELLGRPIEVENPTQAPNLVLIFEDHRAAGSGGCNRFTSLYEFSGDSLSFGPVAATEMACPTGMDMETTFMQSLGSTETIEHYGNVLELKTDNRLLARLEGFVIEEEE